MVHVTMRSGQVLELEEDEVATLISEAQYDQGQQQQQQQRRKPRIVLAKAAASPLYRQSWCWAMTVLIAAVVALLATDSLEVHVSIRGIEEHFKRKATNSDDVVIHHHPSPASSSSVDNHHNEKNDGSNNNDNDSSVATTTHPKEEEEKEEHKPVKETIATTPPPAETSTDSNGSTSQRHVSPALYPIRYRGPELNEEQKSELAAKWGHWALHDAKATTTTTTTTRETLDCSAYPHCDVPRANFPPHAWQTDNDFLPHFLTQGIELVTRAQEAILAEYGHSTLDDPLLSFEERSAMFQLKILDLKGGMDHPPGKSDSNDNGGWTTASSFQGLVRRVLHAIVTQDTFTFVMGGHSSATGHGNYFKQSYTMQFHKVMEPVFARLGVTLHSHNMAQGGLGTIQNAMAMGSLYGNEIDFCMWDSGMTETNNAHYDVFARQALLSGNRVPILWGGYYSVMLPLHEEADVDIGGVGSGWSGIPVTESDDEAATLPYAARYMKCTPEAKEFCEQNKYNAVCWIDRPDVTPPTQQAEVVGGRAGWHPGFRSHQLEGRILAFTVLTAMQEALQQWKNAENYALPDSAWHVTDYYQNIRNQLAHLKTTLCFTDAQANLPTTRICHTALKGVSEFTPRFRPEHTSIRSIMKDPSAIQPAPSNLYSGPDVYNPALEPGQGAINYLAIIENDATSERRQLVSVDASTTTNSSSSFHLLEGSEPASNHVERSLNAESSSLVQGRGWSLYTKAGDIHCNGTWDSECGRAAGESCLLSGHNDGRGGLLFDSFSGWLLLRLKSVKEGIIIVKFESWHGNGGNGATAGWTAENNGGVEGRLRQRRLGQSHRDLKSGTPEINCDDFVFDYAINGQIHSLTKTEFLEKRIMVQRVVETLTLLDDPNFSNNEETDVELGIRIRGCQRTITFSLTHVYWA